MVLAFSGMEFSSKISLLRAGMQIVAKGDNAKRQAIKRAGNLWLATKSAGRNDKGRPRTSPEEIADRPGE
jgi:hypothetical protein